MRDRMSNVQGLGGKLDTGKLRIIAKSFLDEMDSSEEFLNKLKAVEDDELASSLFSSSKDMARYLISTLDAIDKQNAALDLALAEIKKLEEAARSKSMYTVRLVGALSTWPDTRHGRPSGWGIPDHI